ncbi:hypothetical protein MGYG_00810 [Nannizzia gypsea CBS 118893]|uniref:Cytochrome oxidase c assembly-domain-containing protein n=1 Tax=Arthroderma gypseum (strain ATCC MYA-4604 / CBS 118893) TaxID=535722 RepID=E5R1Z0_ARTGP|nr:hypothetical protein MGYG_00810 [Nannizzia gypsea CBS 118893]EFQ97769.1 hypothetical protein MGYG_00810 [Nannizzia gypsea CBS 118893]
MSRSASDATRFTATGPYAYSKSAMSSPASSKWSGLKVKSSQPSQPSPGQGTQETPREKVERLRAQARANRIAQSFSPMDKIVNSGRTWADRFHRAAVFSLIAASGIAGVLTVYSMTSLISHNRRQRELFIEKELESLLDARKAYVAGTATQQQIELLRKEKAADEEKRLREEAKKQTMFYKARSWLFDGPDAIKTTSADAEAHSQSQQSPEINTAQTTPAMPAVPTEPQGTEPANPRPSNSSWSSWTSWGGASK